MVWSEDVDRVLRAGRFLEKWGVRNWALTREQALTAIDQLAEARIGVLGGDVWIARSSDLFATGDNWFSERRGDESEADFVERSLAHARAYIMNYRLSAQPLFAIVPAGTQERGEGRT